ncbi:AI-2E family transporter [Chelativorans sp. YIM 93263]|uniref:AI-2E family transporter n=1 Tax=Chelativorans sp. YIM 93263 TaxID=2906648 RepID=UPI002379C9D2|nr:AI-2E family transporter [Chelativorans sp. YIM 93263]
MSKLDPQRSDGPPSAARASEDGPHWTIVGLLLIAVFAALSYAQAFVLPVLLAFLVALTLSPVVRFFGRRRVPPFLTAAGLVLAVLASLAVGFYYLSSPVAALLDDLPRIGIEIERKLNQFRAPVEEVQQATEQIEGLAATDTEQSPSDPEEVVVREPGLLTVAAANAPEAAARGFFAVVLLLFLLSSGDLFYIKIVRAMPTLTDKKKALKIARDIERELSHYLSTIALINGSLGLAVGIGLWAIGMPNPALWGTLAAVLNFIPYVGAVIGIGLVTAVALGTFPTLSHAALVPAYYLFLTTLEGQFVTPTVLGRRLAMNPVAVFLAIAFWGWLWGIIGMLVAVPLMVAIKIFCSHIEPLRTFADFFSAEQETEPGQPEEESPRA